MAAICAMSSHNCGFIMMPVHQKQTTESAVLKHRRSIEESLMKNKLTVAWEVRLLFSKPDSIRSDGRAMSQLCLVTVATTYKDSSPWLSSSAITTGRLGPVPLIRISEMLGFDEVVKPSASARVEQSLVLLAVSFEVPI